MAGASGGFGGSGLNVTPTTGKEGDGFWSSVKSGIGGAADDFFGSLGRGARQAAEVFTEQGRQVLEELPPLWANALFEQQKEDQLDDPTFGDKFNTLVRFTTFAMQQGMIWVGLGALPTDDGLNRLSFYLGAGAQAGGQESPEDAPNEADRKTGEALGRRVAEITMKLHG